MSRHLKMLLLPIFLVGSCERGPVTSKAGPDVSVLFSFTYQQAQQWLPRLSRPLFEEVRVFSENGLSLEDEESLQRLFLNKASVSDRQNHWYRRADARVDVDVSRVEGETVVVSAEAHVVWRGDDDPFIVEGVLAEAEVPLGDQDRQRAALGRAVQALSEGVRAKDALRSSSTDELLAIANGDDPHAAIWSLQLLARRKSLRGQEIAKLLSSPNRDVGAAALQALVAIRDPETVSALAGSANLKDYEQLRMIMEAVTAIGGEEAVEFLDYLESGHPDPTIQALAKEDRNRVLKRLRKTR